MKLTEIIFLNDVIVKHRTAGARMQMIMASIFTFLDRVLTTCVEKEIREICHCGYPLLLASFTEIKTGYRGFEMKQNPVFHMLVLCSEN